MVQSSNTLGLGMTDSARRMPDDILADIGTHCQGNGRPFSEMLALLHEVIEDINSSWILALEDREVDHVDIGNAVSTVLSYIVNHYGEA